MEIHGARVSPVLDNSINHQEEEGGSQGSDDRRIPSVQHPNHTCHECQHRKKPIANTTRCQKRRPLRGFRHWKRQRYAEDAKREENKGLPSVSYTHLTLPTSDLV